jgi:hypothetical protein
VSDYIARRLVTAHQQQQRIANHLLVAELLAVDDAVDERGDEVVAWGRPAILDHLGDVGVVLERCVDDGVRDVGRAVGTGNHLVAPAL